MKPLGIKAYGSIPHLPGSRLGPGDHTINPGQARLCTEGGKNRRVYVQEKMDGSCVAVLRQGNELICLNRKGYDVRTGTNVNHRLFYHWVMQPEYHDTIMLILEDGERLVGEWLAQVHTIKYPVGYPDMDDPFFAFDIMRGSSRLPFSAFKSRLYEGSLRFGVLLQTPILVRDYATPVDEAWQRLCWLHLQDELYKTNGAYLPEGLIYRVEHGSKVDFLAKWVRKDFEPGLYCKNCEPIYKWHTQEQIERAKKECGV